MNGAGERSDLGLRRIDIREAGKSTRIEADCLALAGGWNPTVHLSCHLGGRPVWSQDIAAFVPAADAVPGLDAAGDRVAAAGQGVQAAKAGHLPEIGIAGAWEANAEDFIGADGTNWSVFLGANFRVFDGHARRSNVRR